MKLIWTKALSLLLALLMVVSPQELYALQVQARINQAVAAAVLGDTPSTTTIRYTYDDNGNLLTKGLYDPVTDTTAITDQYAYDFENRMIKSGPQGLPPTAQTTIYTYDADGLRTGQAAGDGSSATAYLLDKNRPYAEVLVESRLAGTTAKVTTYCLGDDRISLHQTTPGVPGSDIVRYYHYDGQMSVRQLTDPAGLLTDRYVYDAFGGQAPDLEPPPATLPPG